MAFAPGLQRIDDGAQALADLRQAVLYPRRHLGIDFSDDQPVVLERAQLLCQHALGDPRHPASELAKALRPVLQMEQDDALPLAVDQIKCRLDRAARPMREIPSFHVVISISIQTGTISLK